MEILIVIDMQHDFIDGALGTAEAQKILPHVVEKVKNWSGEIIFTRDTHDENYLLTQEGKQLPVPHCIKGSQGWEIHEDLRDFVSSSPLDKPNFGSLDLAQVVRERMGNTPESELTLTLLGLCTDICVISNGILLKPAFPEATIQVVGDCCAGVTVESHQQALAVMSMCQIQVI